MTRLLGSSAEAPTLLMRGKRRACQTCSCSDFVRFEQHSDAHGFGEHAPIDCSMIEERRQHRDFREVIDELAILFCDVPNRILQRGIGNAERT